MIIRAADSGLVLITQPDHAALAARLIETWSDARFPPTPQRSTILFAVAEHDNGWREPDSAPIVSEDGQLLDFIHAPADVRRGVWPRGVDRLADAPYAAALVAQHAIHVNDRHRASSDWRAFFDEMTMRRSRLLARAQRTEDELLADYFFVRMADLMSLVFCNRWRDEHTYHGYRLVLDGGDRLRVFPDPFDGREIAFEIAGCAIESSRFTSSDAAWRAFQAAPRVTLRGVASGA